LKIRREQRPNWKDRPKTSGYEVIVPPGDDAMKHYKRLKKRMTKDGFFQELKDRRYFIPNPIKRLEAKRRGKREWARKQKELEKNF
jgi:ribosomal protein S21|tara:strand:- start:755 stop:1012 length:258 start_codon:yes stop_codon:yes gene_type:complete